MRYVPLSDVRLNMVLATDIYDIHGRVKMTKGRAIGTREREVLNEYKYNGIYVDDPVTADVDVRPLISDVTMQRAMKAIKKHDIDECIRIAADIVNEIRMKREHFLDFIDPIPQPVYLYAHSVQAAVVACVIGMELRIRPIHLPNLVLAAMLMDLGLLSIPEEIRNKSERLTNEEYEEMKRHTELSYQLVWNYKTISDETKEAILFHHENVDGSGYPKGSFGSEQSQMTKILHVADVYCAMISERPFKSAYSAFEAKEYLMGGCGILFDQDVVNALIQHTPTYPVGTDVLLSNGKRAIVAGYDSEEKHRPWVVLEDSGEELDLSLPSNKNINLTSIYQVINSDIMEQEEARMRMIRPVEKDNAHRIMVVDDLKTNLMALRDILGERYPLILVKSGQQALSYLEKNKLPDLILMDIDMPEMNGIEATEKINEMTGAAVPVLFVTAHCDKETVLACRKLNPAGYVVRPYNAVFIKSEIDRILKGQ